MYNTNNFHYCIAHSHVVGIYTKQVVVSMDKICSALVGAIADGLVTTEAHNKTYGHAKKMNISKIFVFVMVQQA